MQTNQQRFARYALIVLIVNIVVILWGGFVSASGAGDGCGEAWPLCADAAERTATPIETFIELFHRATSGIALIMVVIMFVRARRWFEKLGCSVPSWQCRTLRGRASSRASRWVLLA